MCGEKAKKKEDLSLFRPLFLPFFGANVIINEKDGV